MTVRLKPDTTCGHGPAKAGHYVQGTVPAKAGHYVQGTVPAKAGHYVPVTVRLKADTTYKTGLSSIGVGLCARVRGVRL